MEIRTQRLQKINIPTWSLIYYYLQVRHKWKSTQFQKKNGFLIFNSFQFKHFRDTRKRLLDYIR